MDEFRTKIFQIGLELTSSDLHQLKYLCKDIIPAGKAELITTPLDFLQELERVGELGKDNPHFLAKCLIRIKRIDLKDKLLDAARPKEEELFEELHTQMRTKQKASQFELFDGDVVEDGKNRAQTHLSRVVNEGSTFNLTENQRRWLVIGICLNAVLLPPLRRFLEQNILNHYSTLKANKHIDNQVYGGQLRGDGKCDKLKYRSINNNDTIKKERNYDYKVTSAVDLGKLYLKLHMAKFTGFDNTCDLSAVLGILSSASVFSSDVQDSSSKVQQEVRNEWGHCNFQSWDETKFADSFSLMDSLLKALKLSSEDEKTVADELTGWRTKGVQICIANTVPPELLKDIEDKVNQLYQEFKLAEERFAQLSQDVENLALLQKEVRSVLENLKTVQDDIQSLKQRVGCLEEKAENNEKEAGRANERVGLVEEKVVILRNDVDELKAWKQSSTEGPC